MRYVKILFMLFAAANFAAAGAYALSESEIIADWKLQSCGNCAKDCAEQIERINRILENRGIPAAEAKNFFGELEKLKSAADSEEKYLSLRRLKRAAMFASADINFSEVVCSDSPYPAGSEAPHESRFKTENTAVCGARLLRLDIFSGEEKVLAPAFGEAAIWRSDLDFDARKIVFCMRQKGNASYNLYTVDVDGQNLCRLTDSDYNDVDPAWLPDGGIVFCTSRANCYVRCGGSAFRSTILARCGADGKNIYFISTNNEADFMPYINSDGSIIYCRWEYVDKNIFRVQSLWTVNPDGTNPQVFWGGQSHYPDLKIGAIPIPDSDRFIFSTSSHHNVFHAGVGVIAPNEGRNYPNGIYNLTPHLGWTEADESFGQILYGNKYVKPIGRTDTSHGSADKFLVEKFAVPRNFTAFYSPYPVSKNFYLVSAMTGKIGYTDIVEPASKFSLYLADFDGNMELLAKGRENLLYAQPLRSRKTPRVIPSSVRPVGELSASNRMPPKGVLYSANVYENSGISQNSGKYLRVIEHCAATYQDGVRDSTKQFRKTIEAIGIKWDGSYGVSDDPSKNVEPRKFSFLSGETSMSLLLDESHKRILGEIPIESDGSVSVEIPSMRAVYFQILDKNRKVLQTMRSSTHVASGEMRGCLGCHATRFDSAPHMKASKALRNPPQKLSKPFGDMTFGFERYIQPILDKRCVECHNPSSKDVDFDLTSRKIIPDGPFTSSYANLIFGKRKSLAECDSAAGALSAYRVYPSLDTDMPSSESTIAPMKVLSFTSPLVRRLEGGHCPKLTKEEFDILKAWIDLNCPFYGEEDVLEKEDVDHDVYVRSKAFQGLSYLPKMRTAPDVDRAFCQDKYRTQDDRCPKRPDGKVMPSIKYNGRERTVVLPE